MNTIKTNELLFKADFDNFVEAFDIIEIQKPPYNSEEGKYDFVTTSMLDNPLILKNTLSILHKAYRKGVAPCIYILMSKSEANLSDVRNVLRVDEKYETVTIRKVRPSELEVCDFLQLCFNGKASTDDDIQTCNLTGGLYIYNSSLIKKRAGRVSQINAIQLKITPMLRVNMNVTTFTDIQQFRNAYGDVVNTPLYNVGLLPPYTLKRVFSVKKGDVTLVKKQMKDKRATVTFLDLSSYEKINSSKMGLLQTAIDAFHHKYGKWISVRFREIEEFDFIDHAKKETTDAVKAVCALMEKKKVVIVNHTEAKSYEDKLKTAIMAYCPDAEVKPEPDENALNIIMIHDAEYYQKRKEHDVHEDLMNDLHVVTQHITVEDFFTNKKGKDKKENSIHASVQCVVYQLLIKEDLKQRRFSMFNWCAIDEDMTFIYPYGKNGCRSAVMTVKKDGSFDIRPRSPLQMSMFVAFECDEDNNPLMCIKQKTGEEYLISTTSWYTIPDTESLMKKLAANDRALRNREARDAYLSSVLDIKMFRNNDESFGYFVGEIGDGMQTSIQNAAIIRNVEARNGGTYENFRDKILPLMNVMFVRNNRLTVVPFPFKYLYEWAAAQPQ